MNFAIAFLDTLVQCVSLRCTITTQVEISQNNPLLGSVQSKSFRPLFWNSVLLLQPNFLAWCFEDYLLAYLNLGRNLLSSLQAKLNQKDNMNATHA
jgi:hypothetical protein